METALKYKSFRSIRYLSALGGDVCAGINIIYPKPSYYHDDDLYNDIFAIIWFAYTRGVPLSSPLFQRNTPHLAKRSRLHVKIRARAARRAYFWWVPLCFDRGRRAGRRTARRNLAAFRRLTA